MNTEEIIAGLSTLIDDYAKYQVLKRDYETLRLQCAGYLCYLLNQTELYGILDKQLGENKLASIGEFDGFSYDSRRANAVFRTIEDMLDDGIITKDQYSYIKYVK